MYSENGEPQAPVIISLNSFQSYDPDAIVTWEDEIAWFNTQTNLFTCFANATGHCLDQSIIEGTPPLLAVHTDISFNSGVYELCDGGIPTVTWNGYHNIQEVTEDGYTQYASATAVGKTAFRIGEAIHGFENSPHSESIDGLEASVGETRYFICTSHPASKFSTTCPTRRRLKQLSPVDMHERTKQLEAKRDLAREQLKGHSRRPRTKRRRLLQSTLEPC